MGYKRNIVIADCTENEIRSFKDALNGKENTFESRSHIANWKRKSVFTELRRYLKYFLIAFLYFIKRKQYRIIMGWQQFYALIFCFFCTVFSVKKQTIVVALNFTYKEKRGKFAKIYRWFMGKCVSEKYLDYLHVPSEEYAEYVSKEFSFPRDRIIVAGFGVIDRFDELSVLAAPNGYEKDAYALAIGRSNRDYDFLIRAWNNIDFPLVIISDTYKKSSANKNVTIYRDIAGEESNQWIANCGLMIIPIDDGAVCSGDTVLLTAMSLRRKIIVTTPSTLAEMYIEDGVNAILAEKDEIRFAETVKQMLFSDDFIDLGERARRSYLNSYTISAMGRIIYSRIFSDKDIRSE